MNMHARTDRAAAIARGIGSFFKASYAVLSSIITGGGLTARSYLNSENSIKYLTATPDHQELAPIYDKIALAFAINTLIYVSLTRLLPTIKQLNSEKPKKPPQEKKHIPFETIPYASFRLKSANLFRLLAKANCTYSGIMTLAFTYISWARAYRKFNNSPAEEFESWPEIAMSLFATAMAVHTYWVSTLQPGFENINSLADFIESGKFSDINFKRLFSILLLTSFNLFGSFSWGSYASENLAKNLPGLRHLLMHSSLLPDGSTTLVPSAAFCSFGGAVTFNSGLLMVLPSVYNFDGTLGIKIPNSTSPCVQKISGGRLKNSYQVTVPLAFGTGSVDVCLAGAVTTVASTGLTLARTEGYSPYAPTSLTLGSLAGAGGIALGFAFSVRGGLKRMLPEEEKAPEEKKDTLTEPQSDKSKEYQQPLIPQPTVHIEEQEMTTPGGHYVISILPPTPSRSLPIPIATVPPRSTKHVRLPKKPLESKAPHSYTLGVGMFQQPKAKPSKKDLLALPSQKLYLGMSL